MPEAFWVAELVREQLLAVTHDELPHSIATRVAEWEWPRIRVEILVERDSPEGDRDRAQGRGAQGRSAPRCASSCPKGAFLELFVKVDKDWQRRSQALDRLGF